MILYTTMTSTYGFRIRLLLAMKGLSAEIRLPPDGYRSVAYRKIFPTGLVPVLDDDGLILGEADVIAQYLDELHPTPPLMPTSPAERARTRLLSRYHDLYLEAALKVTFPLIPQKVRDPAQIAAAETALNERMQDLGRLADPAPFLAGGMLTLADLAFPSTLAAMDTVATELGMSIRYPEKLSPWRAEIDRHPVIGPMLTKYRETLALWLDARLRGQSPASIKA